MSLYAVQVVGEGSFPLPPFSKPFASLVPISWKFYGNACPCVFQKKNYTITRKISKCQDSCKTKTAFWTIIENTQWCVEDLEKNLQNLFGDRIEKTEIHSFQDENGVWVNVGDTKGEGREKKRIRKLCRSKHLILVSNQPDSGVVLESLSRSYIGLDNNQANFSPSVITYPLPRPFG